MQYMVGTLLCLSSYTYYASYTCMRVLVGLSKSVRWHQDLAIYPCILSRKNSRWVPAVDGNGKARQELKPEKSQFQKPLLYLRGYVYTMYVESIECIFAVPWPL